MAGVTARKRGAYWEYRFDLASVDGRRKQHSKSGFRTKTEAMKAGTQALAKYNRGGEFAEPSQMSLSDWLDKWLESSVRVNCSRSTYDTYRRLADGHVRPALGKLRISALSRTVLSDFVSSLCNKGYTRKYASLIVNVLSASLSHAVKLGVIDSYHRECLAFPKQYDKRVNVREAISQEDYQKLFEVVPEDYRPVLTIGWLAGLRSGEILALRWDDVDFEADTIHVARRVYEDRIGPPKDNSERTIRMGKTLHSYLLKLHQEEQDNEDRYGYYYLVGDDAESCELTCKGEARSPSPYRLVVARENGARIKYNALSGVFRRASERLGIKCDSHTLRHSHATHLLEEGVPPKAVQQRLGHKSLTITMEIYAHVTESMQDKLVDALDHGKVFSWSKCGQNQEKQSKQNN